MLIDSNFYGFSIEHKINKKLKHSYISILPTDKKVLIKTPDVSEAYIKDMLQTKHNWLKKQIEKISKNMPQKVELRKEVFLFGKVYSIDDKQVVELKKSLDKLKTDDEKEVLKCYDNFYMYKAKEYLPQVLNMFAEVMNLSYKEVKIKKLKSRWGSCSSKRVITLNSQLLKAPQESIEYVVVHELAHLVHMNHSKQFHNLVDSFIPDVKTAKNKLKYIYLK